MSLITKLFGGKKGEQALTPQEAIQKLRETEEMLTKKSDYLEKQIEQELTKAKQNSRKNKRGKVKLAKLCNQGDFIPLLVIYILILKYSLHV